jgi:inosine-uridine nucleoside N-ribohydrolase
MRIQASILALAAAALFCVAAAAQQGTPAVSVSQIAAAPQLAILDTDIGDDIDDAFALALALRSPELKLLGVTTTYGDTELRARLVDRYLSAVGADIPIAAGPTTAHSNVFTQAAYASRVPKVTYADGVDFLLGQIRVHPGQITLIAIGPLSNVEAAIKRDPETFRKLKRVVMMGGSVYRGYDDGKTRAHRPPDAEWNIKADPAGAQALLASGVPIFMMPLDSTQVRLEAEDREAIFSHGSPLTDQVTLLYHQWSAGSGGHWNTPTLFDPVAVAYAVHPELCPMTPLHLEVDDKGFTRPVEGAAPNAQVCLQSDEKGFLALLMGRILNEKAR